MLKGKGSAYNRRKDNPWIPRNRQKRTWFSEMFDPDHRAEVRAEQHAKRAAILKRKYAGVPLDEAIFALFFRVGNLTQREVAEILDTDTDTVKFAIDLARQRAK